MCVSISVVRYALPPPPPVQKGLVKMSDAERSGVLVSAGMLTRPSDVEITSTESENDAVILDFNTEHQFYILVLSPILDMNIEHPALS